MAALDASMPLDWSHLGFVPGKAIRMFGMRRSGNHAISSWILRNAPQGRSVFLNNCRAARSPFENFAAIEVNGTLTNTGKAKRNMAEQTGLAGPDGVFLVSYEDMSPADFSGGRKASGSFDELLLDADVLVFRSFLNWSASLLKKLQGNTGFTLSRRTSILLRTFERYARLLTILSRDTGEKVVGVCYDKWFSSTDYRGDVLDRLGLPEIDNSTGVVQRYGGGSSFQKDATAPDELQTDQRWRQMAGDPEYLAILHLAARDGFLIEQLSHHFPDDAVRLRAVAQCNPLPEGILT